MNNKIIVLIDFFSLCITITSCIIVNSSFLQCYILPTYFLTMEESKDIDEMVDEFLNLNTVSVL